MGNPLQEMNSDFIGEVRFGKPDRKAIADEGLLCADMHFHTNCSDSFTDVANLLRLARIRNTGVAITDHNLIASLKKIDFEKEDVFVIPGIEVSTSDGPHILVYFYGMSDLEEFWSGYIEPRLQSCPWLALRDCTVQQLMDRLEGENCVISGAHPMGYMKSNKGIEICSVRGYISDETVRRLDAYEVLCSGMLRDSNLAAREAADRHGLKYTGGTDGHLLDEVGNVVTYSDASDLDGFLDNILKGRAGIIGTEKGRFRRLEMGAASFTKFVMHGGPAIYVQAAQGGKSANRAIKKRMK